MNIREAHQCEKSEGKMVSIGLDLDGNTYCGHCHKRVDYSRPIYKVDFAFVLTDKEIIEGNK